jgi:hypothetical protein
MSRRSPMNERYQKNTSPAGKTRRSASSAKPKREAGGQSPAPKKSKPRPRLRDSLSSGPSTPEIQRWRRIWWIGIGLALVTALVAWLVPAVRYNRALSAASIALYLVFLGGAVYIDMFVIRKLRKQAQDAARAKGK